MMIRRVSEGLIVVGDQSFGETIALTPDGLVDNFSPPPVSELAESHFDAVLEAEAELLVLGTGKSIIFPPRELTFAFARRRIGLEVMDTAAAARTFNVLAGDGRRGAAVLYV
jgi:uncharacterized protein